MRHDASGELVGISELYLPRARPWFAFQGDTGVDPAHRGHGLGAWMKAVNHLRLRDERPDVEVVQTWNADSNEPMLRINRALGFAAGAALPRLVPAADLSTLADARRGARGSRAERVDRRRRHATDP